MSFEKSAGRKSAHWHNSKNPKCNRNVCMCVKDTTYRRNHFKNLFPLNIVQQFCQWNTHLFQLLMISLKRIYLIFAFVCVERCWWKYDLGDNVCCNVTRWFYYVFKTYVKWHCACVFILFSNRLYIRSHWRMSIVLVYTDWTEKKSLLVETPTYRWYQMKENIRSSFDILKMYLGICLPKCVERELVA